MIVGSRNIRGPDRLFVGKNHSAYAFFEGLYEGELTTEVRNGSTTEIPC